jgi:ferrous iron transport protein B
MSRLADTKAAGRFTVAICGNPNCGKTTIFNAITGLRQKVGNYPGVTVDKVTGTFYSKGSPETAFQLIDIPGSYSLAAFSPDEYIATQALFGSLEGEPPPNLVICVIDATNLERGLYMLFQVMQIDCPIVVALNMVDLARQQGIEIKASVLSKLLGGLPVVEVVGSRRIGIDILTETVGRMASAAIIDRPRVYAPDVEAEVAGIQAAVKNGHRTRAEYLRVLFDAGGPAESSFVREAGRESLEIIKASRTRLTGTYGSLSAAETGTLTKRAAEIHAKVVSGGRQHGRSISDRIDKVALHPVLGPILLLVLMTLMFQSIFSWAEPLMNLVDSLFASLAGLVEASMVEGPLRSLLADGVIGGVGSVVIFLPQILILFVFISFLEDSGYMPRAAFIVDRAFGWCGLSGKSFIPMLSSFACAIPGIMATRTIEDRRLRIITIMVAPLMTCSARLPVYAIMIAAFIPHHSYLGLFNSQGLVLTALYLLGIVLAVGVSFLMTRFVYKSPRSSFLMEMPTYKLPTVNSILIRVFNRARSFLGRAGTVIAAITIIVWALSYYPHPAAITERFDQQAAAAVAVFTDRQAALGQQVEAAIAVLPETGQQVADQVRSQVAGAESLEALNEIPPPATTTADETILAGLIRQERALTLSHEQGLARLERERAGEQLRNSYFARAGKSIEPLFVQLGWDWKVTMAALASFPAREVIIATLGTIYNLGGEVDDESSSLVDKMRHATWEDGPRAGQRVFTPAVALSVMVFFALCCQCGATVVTIRHEAGGWKYAIATFSYMTGMAFIGAFLTYQFFSWLGV